MAADPAPGGSFVFAAMAGASSTDGTFTASSLKASGSWAVGLQSGAFEYTHPIGVPPSSGGQSPELSLEYSSSAVDGYVANENGQASKVGLGWDLPIPFIERKFADCTGNDVGSKCWAGENAQISLGGMTATLLQSGLQSPSPAGDVTPFSMDTDQGYRVERVYGGGNNVNGDGIGFYWKVTDTAGTQYFFGREDPALQTSSNNSTLTMPVLNLNPGDPCYGGWNTCTMAWRWNLSYIVDTNGNAQTFRYLKARYTYRPWAGTLWDYDGDGLLVQIGYGRRTADVKTLGPAQKVELAYRWRCDSAAAGIPAGQCNDGNLPDASHPAWYPDIPFDIACWAFNGSSWCGNGAPTQMVFYSLRRLDAVFTYVKASSGFQAVDTTYIAGGYRMVGTDYSTASLVVNSVWRVGADNATALPRTEFGYTMLANRWAGGDIAQSGRPRISEVLTDLGARIQPTYGQPDPCSSAQNVLPEWQNASDCFRVRRSDGTHDHYKKYLASQVQVLDRDGSPTQTTTYGYSVNSNPGGAAPAGQGGGWHSDNQIVTPLSKQGWTQFRGYQTVTVTEQRAAGSPASQVTTFFRGLHGDHTDQANTTPTRSVNVTTAAKPSGAPTSASYARSIVDDDALRGQVLEQRVLDGAGVEQSAVQRDYQVTTLPLNGAPTETRPWGSNTHPLVRVGETIEATYVPSAGTVATARDRSRLIKHGYDPGYARAVWEEDSGDPTNGIGATCDWTTWTTNSTLWVWDAARRVVSANGTCGSSEPTGSALIGRREFLYDNLASGQVGAGNVTEVLDWTGPNGNVTTPYQYAATKHTYDSFGRLTGTQSPNNYGTALWASTAYTAPDGPVTALTTTNELNHATTTTLDPRWATPLVVTDANTRATTLGYDTFGRLTSVRRPGDAAASTTYAYTVNQWAPSVVATTNQPGSGLPGITGYIYLDSLGRAFQSESPSPTAGQRILSGTQFDEHGNAAVAVGAFVPSPAGTPGTPVGNFYDTTFTNSLPSRTQTTFDALDRATAQALKYQTSTVWTASTAYAGLTTTATPAGNGSDGPALHATESRVDLFGRVVRSAIKRGTPSDVVTTYAYNTAGRLTTITSPKNAVTSYTYDWLGRRTQTVDPDAGTSIASYRPGGQVSYSRDGAGLESWSTVDGVGRVTLVETGPAASKVTAVQNVYDTALKGTLTSATRYTGGSAYTEATTYDVRYRASAVTRTVPGQLMGGAAGSTMSWTTSMTYDGMDRPTSTTYPAANGLPAETVTSTYTAQGYGYQVSPSLASVPRYVGDTVHTNIGQLAYRLRGDWATTASVQQSFWYDAATGRMTGAWARTPSGSSTDNVQSQGFSYANTGEVTAVVNNVDNQRECFSYDGLSRLTLAGTTASGATGCTPDMTTGPTPYKETYGYDDDGSMTQLVRSTSPTAATTYGYTYGATTLGGTALAGGPHALTKVTTNGTASSGYGYDGAGRQTTVTNGTGAIQSASARTWNALGQLATVGGSANTFTDGPDGSRWVRTATNTVGTTTTTVYLPGQDVSRSLTSGGAATLSGVRYYTGHDGEVVATRSTAGGGNGTLTWVISNYQSSNTTAVTTTGVITRDRYTPYGLNRATTTNTGYALPGVTGSDRGWIGRPRDDNTGLNQLGARYYDPATAHFISPDPLNIQESPQAANPYTYANDNPTTLSDPTGLAATYTTYTVRSGDNWNTVASRNGTTLTTLRSLNGGSLNALRVGQVVRVGIRNTTKSSTSPALYITVTGSKPKPVNGLTRAGAGAGSAVKDTLTGLWSTVRHPVTTAKNVKACASTPKGCATSAWQATKQPITTRWSAGNKAGAIGYGITNAAGMIFGSKGIGGFKAATGTASKLSPRAVPKAGNLPCNCFVAGTKVQTPAGEKPIEDIAIGERVWARNLTTGVNELRSVTGLFQKHAAQLMSIAVDGRTTFSVTREHPLHVQGEGWVLAGDLRVGDQLTRRDGSAVPVTSISVEQRDAIVYNFEVEGNHNYYITKAQLLVHNCPSGDDAPDYSQLPDRPDPEDVVGGSVHRVSEPPVRATPGEPMGKQGLRGKIATGVRALLSVFDNWPGGA